MDMTELTTFAAVARAGAITAAARDLNTVQSNVTGRIKALEDEVGLPLFDRHSRGMALTEAGRRLLPYAERVLALVKEAKVAVRDGDDRQGALQIGAMETTAAVRLPALLAAYHKAHPQIRLSLRTGPTAELTEAVLRRDIDGAFVAGPIDHPDLIATPAFVEELGIIAPASVASLADLATGGGLTVLTFRLGCSYRQRLEQALAGLGLPAYARLEFGTLDGLLGCVAAGIGITLLPRAVYERSASRDGLSWHPVQPAERSVTTLFIRRRDAYESRAMTSLLAQFA